MEHGPLVTTDWLTRNLHSPDVRVVDCRWYLKPFDNRDGLTEYQAGHIPGATHLLWNTDLADPDHPDLGMLAGPDRYAEVMSGQGIGDETFVVCYDDQHVTVAARIWWTLRVYGHDRVAVLDGGYPKWVAEGRSVTSDIPAFERRSFTPHFRSDLYSTRHDVLAAIDNEEGVLVDSRMQPARIEDGGYIPGSLHLPGIEFTNDDGTWDSVAEIQRHLAESRIRESDQVITYCRGGVGAAGTALALAIAGRDNVAVYDGSWSEWILDSSAPRVPLKDGGNS
jgi:thiosulfate/3-mercaptopyruvate sulfurtransferase